MGVLFRIKRTTKEIICITQANRIILNYPEHKSQKNMVNLHYYHADWKDGIECNLGDYLSLVIVKWLCEKNGINMDCVVSKTKHLYAIGSILQMGYQNATVWGTGFAFELNPLRQVINKRRMLDIRSVRGPKTRNSLMKMGFECPKVFGDPAVLMPFIYSPQRASALHTDFLVIPHFSMEDSARKRYGDEHVLSMNTKDYKSVIDRICSTDKVISSSLHGIILAEAYGVPAIFYQDRDSRFNYKYFDWYESTGRNRHRHVQTIEHGINESSDILDSNMLQLMQNQLMDTFPKDLWEK